MSTVHSIRFIISILTFHSFILINVLMLGMFVSHTIPSGGYFTLLLLVRKLKPSGGKELMKSQGYIAGRSLGSFLLQALAFSSAPHLHLLSPL